MGWWLLTEVKISMDINTCIPKHVLRGLWWPAALVVKCATHSVGLVGGLLHWWLSVLLSLWDWLVACCTLDKCGGSLHRIRLWLVSCKNKYWWFKLRWLTAPMVTCVSFLHRICWWLAALMTMCQLFVARMIKYASCLSTEFVGDLLHLWPRVSYLLHAWSNMPVITLQNLLVIWHLWPRVSYLLHAWSNMPVISLQNLLVTCCTYDHESVICCMHDQICQSPLYRICWWLVAPMIKVS